MARNPELMAAIGKSFANQQQTLSKMVDPEEEEEGFTFECSSCNLVQTEETMSYSDNTCPHCGSTMYRKRNYKYRVHATGVSLPVSAHARTG